MFFMKKAASTSKPNSKDSEVANIATLGLSCVKSKRVPRPGGISWRPTKVPTKEAVAVACVQPSLAIHSYIQVVFSTGEPVDSFKSGD